MPKIIIQTIPRGGDRAEVTLSERVVAANIDDPHYAAQLIERLAWATADAQAIESQGRVSEQVEDARMGRSPLAQPSRTPARDRFADSHRNHAAVV